MIARSRLECASKRGIYVPKCSLLLVGVVMSAERKSLERTLFRSSRDGRENRRALLDFLIKGTIIALSIGLI